MADFLDTFAGTAGTDLSAHVADSGESWTEKVQSPTAAPHLLFSSAGSLFPSAFNGKFSDYYSSWTQPGLEFDVVTDVRVATAGGYAGPLVGYDPATGNGYTVLLTTAFAPTAPATLWLLRWGGDDAASVVANYTLDPAPDAGSTVRIKLKIRDDGGHPQFTVLYAADGTTGSLAAMGSPVTYTDGTFDAGGKLGVIGFYTAPGADAGFQVSRLATADADAEPTPPTPGVATLTSRGSSTVSLSATAAAPPSGETVSVQWYRRSVAGGTPTLVSGATGNTLTDTPPVKGRVYWYDRLATASGGGTATTHAIPAATTPPPLTVIEIGDSNVEAFAALAMAARLKSGLESLTGRSVTVVRIGKSGSTTAAWLDGGAFLAEARAAAATAKGSGQEVAYSIQLTTNDAKLAAPVAAASVVANLTNTTAKIKSDGDRAMIHRPCAVTAGGGSGGWDDASVALLQEYGIELGSLDNGDDIRVGSPDLFAETSLHPEERVDGVHFTDPGGERVGYLKARDLAVLVGAVSTGPAAGVAGDRNVFGAGRIR